MDMLSPAEKAEVEAYVASYPELKTELLEIERSLEVFAKTAAVQPPPGVKERVLQSIRSTAKVDVSERPRSFGMWPAIAALFGAGLLVLGYLFYQKDEEVKNLQGELSAVRDTCQTTNNNLTQQLDILRQLTLPHNKILSFQPTPGFASTDLYLHTNKESRKNFIQVRNLPDIAANQTFQLWSIRPNQPPAPLNTFSVPDSGLVEVTYVDGTEVYAITIEPTGGRDTPTLENLIGTVSVAGI